MRWPTKNRIMHGWGLIRFLRLGLAVLILIEAFRTYEWLPALLGAILLMQAIFNVGCCSGNSCEIGHTDNQSTLEAKKEEEVIFNELK